MEIPQTVGDESAVVNLKSLSGMGMVGNNGSRTGIDEGTVVLTDALGGEGNLFLAVVDHHQNKVALLSFFSHLSGNGGRIQGIGTGRGAGAVASLTHGSADNGDLHTLHIAVERFCGIGKIFAAAHEFASGGGDVLHGLKERFITEVTGVVVGEGIDGKTRLHQCGHDIGISFEVGTAFVNGFAPPCQGALQIGDAQITGFYHRQNSAENAFGLSFAESFFCKFTGDQVAGDENGFCALKGGGIVDDLAVKRNRGHKKGSLC